MLIRKVSKGDLEAFVRVYESAYGELIDYKYKRSSEIKKYFKWLYRRDAQGFYLAEEEGQVVGFIAGDANWVNYEGQRVLAIHEIFVIPEKQGKGIGKRLLREVVDHGAEQGLRKVELWVGQNNRKAISFYYKFGFREMRQRGKWILMSMSLGDGLSAHIRDLKGDFIRVRDFDDGDYLRCGGMEI